ncbi:MAG: LuxR C-terminal-related transcriptional regulator, partial [Actinomycetota bacterium]|nr:LuxR C-terminal-related transcriptional regulator [Actinomycetota bacterium]
LGDDAETASDHVLPVALAELARAARTGRAGDRTGAEKLWARADYALQGAPWFRMLGRRLVAEAALADGWGTPALWLEEAQAFFAENRLEELARASRSLLRRVGSEPSRGGGEVEPELAGLGVTRREADVLTLVGEGLSNKDIAARLYLSPRTVEKHVERLLLKTGSGNRAQLAVLATRLAAART